MHESEAGARCQAGAQCQAVARRKETLSDAGKRCREYAYGPVFRLMASL